MDDYAALAASSSCTDCCKHVPDAPEPSEYEQRRRHQNRMAQQRFRKRKGPNDSSTADKQSGTRRGRPKNQTTQPAPTDASSKTSLGALPTPSSDMETLMANTHGFGNAWHLVDCQFQDTAFDLDLIDIDMGAANGERAGNAAFQVCRYQLIIEVIEGLSSLNPNLDISQGSDATKTAHIPSLARDQNHPIQAQHHHQYNPLQAQAQAQAQPGHAKFPGLNPQPSPPTPHATNTLHLLQKQKSNLAGQAEEYHRRSASLHRLGVSLEIFNPDPELEQLFTAVCSKLRSLSSPSVTPPPPQQQQLEGPTVTKSSNVGVEFLEPAFGPLPLPGLR